MRVTATRGGGSTPALPSRRSWTRRCSSREARAARPRAGARGAGRAVAREGAEAHRRRGRRAQRRPRACRGTCSTRSPPTRRAQRCRGSPRVGPRSVPVLRGGRSWRAGSALTAAGGVPSATRHAPRGAALDPGEGSRARAAALGRKPHGAVRGAPRRRAPRRPGGRRRRGRPLRRRASGPSTPVAPADRALPDELRVPRARTRRCAVDGRAPATRCARGSPRSSNSPAPRRDRER